MHGARRLSKLAEVSIRDYVERCGSTSTSTSEREREPPDSQSSPELEHQPELVTAYNSLLERYAGVGGYLDTLRRQVHAFEEVALLVSPHRLPIVPPTPRGEEEEEEEWRGRCRLLEQGRLARMAHRVGPSFVEGTLVQRAALANVRGDSSKASHLVVDVAGRGMSYEPGDRCAVLVANRPDAVSRTMVALGLKEDTEVLLNDRWLLGLAHQHQETSALIPGTSPPKMHARSFLESAVLSPLNYHITSMLEKLLRRTVLADGDDRASAEAMIRRAMGWELWQVLTLLSALDVDVSACVVPNLASLLPPLGNYAYSICAAPDPPADPSEGLLPQTLQFTVGKQEIEADGSDKWGEVMSYVYDSLQETLEPTELALAEAQALALARRGFLLRGDGDDDDDDDDHDSDDHDHDDGVGDGHGGGGAAPPGGSVSRGDVAQVSVGQAQVSGAVEALMTSIGGASRQEGAGGGAGWLPRLDDAVKRELREALSEVIRAVWGEWNVLSTDPRGGADTLNLRQPDARQHENNKRRPPPIYADYGVAATATSDTAAAADDDAAADADGTAADPDAAADKQDLLSPPSDADNQKMFYDSSAFLVTTAAASTTAEVSGDGGVASRRGGVCSHFLHGLSAGDRLRVATSPMPHFRTAYRDRRAPLIMLACGGGMPAYRSFIDHRCRLREKDVEVGEMWLVVGARDLSQLAYRSELDYFTQLDLLTIDVALSHDTHGVVFGATDDGRAFSQITQKAGPKSISEVLHREVSMQRMFFWLEAGAHLYVAGQPGGVGVARDAVRDAAAFCMARSARRDEFELEHYFHTLVADGRVHVDVAGGGAGVHAHHHSGEGVPTVSLSELARRRGGGGGGVGGAEGEGGQRSAANAAANDEWWMSYKGKVYALGGGSVAEVRLADSQPSSTGCPRPA
jgi:sulfite reductase alpha subunit-like flavoprotein